MTGTSRALRRLGVAGLGAVLATVGLVPLTTVAANAATASSVTLSPDSDTAATGTCNPFTATVSAGDSITVNIQQAQPSSTAAGAEQIGFCNPTTTTVGEGSTTTASAGPGGAGTYGANTSAAGSTCTNINATDSTHTSGLSCNAIFTDTNGDGKIIFGVTSNTPGTMSVTAFGDANANGAQELGEPGDTSTKTWVANNQTGTAANTNKVNCTPSSQTNPAGTATSWTCTVTDANGVPLSNQTVNWTITSGPDNGMTGTCTTQNGTNGTTEGQTASGACGYTNNGTIGPDNIVAYLNTNGISGAQSGEPNTALTRTWVQAAPVGSTVSVSCSPNQTATTGGTNNTSSSCLAPTTGGAGSATFTATVVNGVPAQPVSGVVVQWTGPASSGTADATTDTESLSATSCTTDATGKCSVTLNDTLATPNETLTVTATVPLQVGSSSATGAVTWHTVAKAEARNISVAPKTSTQNPGGVQTLTATVKDRFGSPVNGVAVDWSETGPGSFRNGSNTAQCTTATNGTCSVDLTSLTTESGDETVTATIADSNYTGTLNGGSTTNNTAECNAPAGYSNFTSSGTASNGNPLTPNTTGQNQTATGAPAGNCSDTAKVTWGAASTGAPTITFSQPNKTAGQSVTFSGTAPAGSTVTLTWANATTGGAFQPLATVTANSSGQWTYSTVVSYNTTVKATNSAGSNQVSVHVNVKVTITDIRYLGKDARGKCVTRFLGGTFPYIPGAPAWIRNSAVSPTQPIGFTRVFQFGSSGRYDARFGLACGQTYKLFSLISGTGSDGVHYTDNGVGKDIVYKAGTTIATGQ